MYKNRHKTQFSKQGAETRVKQSQAAWQGRREGYPLPAGESHGEGRQAGKGGRAKEEAARSCCTGLCLLTILFIFVCIIVWGFFSKQRFSQSH